MSIARLVPDHLLITGKTSKCSCGQKFGRMTPDEDHLKHVLETVWDEGHYWGRQYRAQALNGDIPTSNPYTEES